MPTNSFSFRHFGMLITIFLLSAPVALGQHPPPDEPKTAPLVPVEVRSFLPEKFEEFSMAEFPSAQGNGAAVLAWSHRGEDGTPSSRVLVVSPKNARGDRKLHWQSPVGELYAPRVEVAPAWKWRGQPVIWVRQQLGAAFMQADFFRETKQGSGHLATLNAEDIEATVLADGPAALILHARRNVVDIPAVMIWNGTGFVDQSRRHPVYFAPLFARMVGEITAGTSTHAQFDVAILAELAGKIEAARNLLASAIGQEERKKTGLDQSLLREMKKMQGRLARTRSRP